MKRAAIYAFYDSNGIVDDYVEYFLNDLVKNIEYLVVMCNGKLSDEGRKKLEAFTPYVVVRKNEGFDIGAYQDGMRYIGWDQLSEYDELVLANDTVFGPVYPFSEMFETMQSRNLDFWGITRHYKANDESFDCEYGYLPEHIQSYFMVFRKKFMKTSEFLTYWKNLPLMKTYKDAVGKHEICFTKRFTDLGFKADTYVDTSDMEVKNPNPLMIYPKELIQFKKCPIFKRRLFFQEYGWYIENSVGQAPMETMEYIKEHTVYDFDMVLDNLLRVCNQADLAECLHFNYILPSNIADKTKIENIMKVRKVALVMHIHYPDLLEMDYRYVSSMPYESDIYLVTNSEEKKAKIEEVFKDIHCRHFEIRVTQNRGRDIASLLTGTKDVLPKYEYICFVHDKKTKQLQPESKGEGFAYKCLENTLYNETYVYNIIDTFEANPRLGLLCPPEPSHADFFPTIGHEWGENFEITKELAEKIGLKAPMDEYKGHMSPLGDYFWFRREALQKLLDMDWEWEDYPEEPIGIDGSLLHAIERVHSFVAQDAGYYSAHVMVDHYARIEYTNLHHQVRGFNKVLQNNGIMATATGAYIFLNDCVQRRTMNDEKMKKEIEELYENSTCWKITAPIRFIGKNFFGK